jgi:transposase
MAHGPYDRAEFESKTIQPPLPNKPRGVPRVDDRPVLTGTRDGSSKRSTARAFACINKPPPKKQSGDYHIGRSRGGLTSKLQLRVSRHGLPLQVDLSAGQMHDAPIAELILQDLPKDTGLLADRGHDTYGIRDRVENQDSTPIIPPKSNRIEAIPSLRRKYRKRNLVEHCINKLKQFRHSPTR